MGCDLYYEKGISPLHVRANVIDGPEVLFYAPSLMRQGLWNSDSLISELLKFVETGSRAAFTVSFRRLHHNNIDET